MWAQNQPHIFMSANRGKYPFNIIIELCLLAYMRQLTLLLLMSTLLIMVHFHTYFYLNIIFLNSVVVNDCILYKDYQSHLLLNFIIEKHTIKSDFFLNCMVSVMYQSLLIEAVFKSIANQKVFLLYCTSKSKVATTRKIFLSIDIFLSKRISALSRSWLILNRCYNAAVIAKILANTQFQSLKSEHKLTFDFFFFF